MRPHAAEPSARNEAHEPSSAVARFGADQSLQLESGESIGPWQIAYQTYGTLNAEKSNTHVPDLPEARRIFFRLHIKPALITGR